MTTDQEISELFGVGYHHFGQLLIRVRATSHKSFTVLVLRDKEYNDSTGMALVYGPVEEGSSHFVWLHHGPWEKDFHDLVVEKKKEQADKIAKALRAVEINKKTEDYRVKIILSAYKS